MSEENGFASISCGARASGHQLWCDRAALLSAVSRDNYIDFAVGTFRIFEPAKLILRHFSSILLLQNSSNFIALATTAGGDLIPALHRPTSLLIYLTSIQTASVVMPQPFVSVRKSIRWVILQSCY